MSVADDRMTVFGEDAARARAALRAFAGVPLNVIENLHPLTVQRLVLQESDFLDARRALDEMVATSNSIPASLLHD